MNTTLSRSLFLLLLFLTITYFLSYKTALASYRLHAFLCNKAELFRHLVGLDETEIYHFMPANKDQSKHGPGWRELYAKKSKIVSFLKCMLISSCIWNYKINVKSTASGSLCVCLSRPQFVFTPY